jgi:hypothetical protein
VGSTLESDVRLYFKPGKASETMFGDSTYHRERIARLVIDAGVTKHEIVKVEAFKDDGVGIITTNSSLVNTLSPCVPEGLSEAIDRMAADETVQAVIVGGGGAHAVAGADIKELEKNRFRQQRAGPRGYYCCFSRSRTPAHPARVERSAFRGWPE